MKQRTISVPLHHLDFLSVGLAHFGIDSNLFVVQIFGGEAVISQGDATPEQMDKLIDYVTKTKLASEALRMTGPNYPFILLVTLIIVALSGTVIYAFDWSDVISF